METALSNVTPCDLLRVVHRHQGSPEDLVTVVFTTSAPTIGLRGEGFSATQTGRPRVAHFIAQNARNSLHRMHVTTRTQAYPSDTHR